MSTHDAIRDALIGMAILNVAVSVAVMSSSAYSGRQKCLQILIVWIVPVIGGVLFGLFMLSQRGSAPHRGYPSGQSEDISQIWDGLNTTDHKH
jgi:phosphate/sulfate permease